ncbi:MAG TPA: mucoidy inhibitor MuiA family protein, partial [Pseudomonadota bacterium]|nr:mucoidy inhibitor MuiA family protein [Pseudomonadota bacterium]
GGRWDGVPELRRGAGARVSRVVLYPDRAQVTREATVSCGDRVLVPFGGLPPAADAASLRAQSSSGHVDGLRSEVRVRSEAYNQKVEELDDKIHQIERQLAALRDQRVRQESTSRVANQLDEVTATLVGREMLDAQNSKSWAAALESMQQARLQGVSEQVELAARQRELAQKLDELRRQRQQTQDAAARRELIAEVLVSCPAGKSATVELSYMVGGARWAPAYEARLGDTDTEVALASYATVTQASGEDWRGTQITLSTAIPRQNATPPELSPLRVYAEPREPPRKVLVSRQELQEHATTPGSGGLPVTGKAGGRAQVVGQGLSAQFVIQAPADVPGDGTPARLLIAESRLRAQLKYRTVPKLLPYVFRVADLTNTAGFPLLAGPVDTFRKGQFFARYELNRVAAGERFLLSFGITDGLKVKRLVVEEIARDRGLLGSTRRHRYSYRYEVQNFLGRTEELELAEHIPVSELDEVKVALDPKTTAGYDLVAADGILTWKVPLRVGEKKVLDLAYYIDVPASYETGG